MNFTKIGHAVATLAFVFGVASVALGLIAVFSGVKTTVNTGMMIDNGFITLVVGLALGVLTDISKGVINDNRRHMPTGAGWGDLIRRLD